MRRILLAACLAALLAGPASAVEKTIAVAAFEYPPIYQNAADKGLACELVIEAFKAVGIDVELRFYPVKRMVESVSSGEVVCGIGGNILFAAPEVADKVSISEPVQFVSQVFMYSSKVYPEGIDFIDLDDMSDYMIGVLSGSGIMKVLEHNKLLSLVPNVTHEGSARQLHAGRVDVWGIVDLTGLMYMKKLFPADYKNYKLTKSFNLGDVSVVFSKSRDKDEEYDAMFRAGLAIIKKNGTYLRVMAKYYGGESAINKDAMTEDMR
ncbi:substrate-binding periplasmic protein [Fundidesulfovibrio agrisoli]|uniref:substrate-binding periplasmic protein n=1 Tax=Fundidesulfovibrio agrisoli TaxID=2922717 RepID=UPI001FABD4EC|nr:transporter substrate-binding domain-containing protein [Fundidesulfovibrio agrisoli]